MYAVFKTDFSKTFQKTNSSRSYSLDPGQEIEISISQYTHSVLGIWESTSIRPVYIWHDNTAFRSRHYSAALLLISAHIGRSGSFPRSCRSFFANNRCSPIETAISTSPLWRQSSHHALIVMVMEFNHIKCVNGISTIRNVHTNWYLRVQSFSTMHVFKYDFIIGLITWMFKIVKIIFIPYVN